MDIRFFVGDDDAARARSFFDEWASSPLVGRRLQRNVHGQRPAVDEAGFWFSMVNCLLTTQQRSGPRSTVERFIRHKPYPLSFEDCCRSKDLGKHAESTLASFGLRRAPTISSQLGRNLEWLQNEGWPIVFDAIAEIGRRSTMGEERAAAAVLAEDLHGIGPKQSRNLLQSLGLTRYEIPIDSRISDWLHNFGFPVHISAAALSDPSYYNLVSDGFQNLCRRADVFPCLMDAAIFASYDPPWAADDVVW